METVSIITINYNGYSDTAELLDSLKKFLLCQGYTYEVIIVDNNSSGNDVELINTYYPWVKVIQSKENRGFSGGNNLGINNSQSDYYFFINNDVIIDSDIIVPLLNRFKVNKNIGAISPKILDSSTKKIIYGGSKPIGDYMIKIHYFTDNDDGCSFSIPYAIGTAMIVKKEVVSKAGFWPELYFLYDEELDWSQKIRKAGFEIWYDSNSWVYHKGSMSTGKNSPLVHYYQTRNRLLLYKRNLTGWHRFYSISFTIFISIPQRCFKFILGKKYSLLNATISGLIDFLRGSFYKRKKSF